MRQLDLTVLVLLVIGGLNWGLVGLAQTDLVNLVFGTSILARLVYVIIGVAAIYEVAVLSGLLHHGNRTALT